MAWIQRVTSHPAAIPYGRYAGQPIESIPAHHLEWMLAMNVETNIATKIEQLLARVEGVHRGSECPRPIKFDRHGEQHAREVARRDAKTVNTAMAPRDATVVDAPSADVSRLRTAAVEPVTGTLARLRPRKGAAR